MNPERTTSKLFNDRLHRLAKEIQAGRLHEITFDLWRNGCCPELTEKQAAAELGRWVRHYGIKVDFEHRLVRDVPVVFLLFR